MLKGSKEKPKKINEKKVHNKPARTTVVNYGVSGFQRIVTVYRAKPVADTNPRSAPNTVPEIESFIIIIQTPIKAITIEINVERLRISLRKK